jgi:hypothetical protein
VLTLRHHRQAIKDAVKAGTPLDVLRAAPTVETPPPEPPCQWCGKSPTECAAMREQRPDVFDARASDARTRGQARHVRRGGRRSSRGDELRRRGHACEWEASHFLTLVTAWGSRPSVPSPPASCRCSFPTVGATSSGIGRTASVSPCRVRSAARTVGFRFQLYAPSRRSLLTCGRRLPRSP